MPLNQTWQALPNLTMLGDAAHLMPPYAGEGVNMAMLDAVGLSHCLTGNNYADPLSAIADYEQQMRTRASATAKQSINAMEAMHAPGAIKFLLNVIGQ